MGKMAEMTITASVNAFHSNGGRVISFSPKYKTPGSIYDNDGNK